MFNVVPQWNPLRLAEDFSTLHNLSGGRAILGVGRGTVPREVLHLNDKHVSIGCHDNPDQQADDDHNREVFEEAMDIIRLALANERFSYHGKHFELPVPGIPDRGSTVQELTLVPRPRHPYEIWQAVTSPPTLEYVPVVGHGAVFWNQHYSFIKRFWDTYGDAVRRRTTTAPSWPPATSGCSSSPCASRTPTRRRCATATPGHDEFWKFLGPYGWSRGYMGDDGKPAKPGLIPTLADVDRAARRSSSARRRRWPRGSQFYRDLLGVEHLTIFPHLLGDPYKKADEQMARFIEEVVPLVVSVARLVTGLGRRSALDSRDGSLAIGTSSPSSDRSSEERSDRWRARERSSSVDLGSVRSPNVAVTRSPLGLPGPAGGDDYGGRRCQTILLPASPLRPTARRRRRRHLHRRHPDPPTSARPLP